MSWCLVGSEMCIRDRCFAGRGYLNRASGSLEELDAEFFFKDANLLAERGLSHVQAIGGTAKVKFLGDSNKKAKLTNFHNFNLSII
jgi:hypothetical protein